MLCLISDKFTLCLIYYYYCAFGATTGFYSSSSLFALKSLRSESAAIDCFNDFFMGASLFLDDSAALSSTSLLPSNLNELFEILLLFDNDFDCTSMFSAFYDSLMIKRAAGYCNYGG